MLVDFDESIVCTFLQICTAADTAVFHDGTGSVGYLEAKIISIGVVSAHNAVCLQFLVLLLVCRWFYRLAVDAIYLPVRIFVGA